MGEGNRYSEHKGLCLQESLKPARDRQSHEGTGTQSSCGERQTDVLGLAGLVRHVAVVPRVQKHSKQRNDTVRSAFLKDFLLTYR